LTSNTVATNELFLRILKCRIEMRNPAYGGGRRKRACDSQRARCDRIPGYGGLAM